MYVEVKQNLERPVALNLFLLKPQFLSLPSDLVFKDCLLCQNIDSGAWSMLQCGCQYHEICLKKEKFPFCKKCKKATTFEIGGQPPNGIMKLFCSLLNRKIVSHFENGIQTYENPNPGNQYTGGDYEILLPHSYMGQKISQILKRLFDNHLLYVVENNKVTLNPIVENILARKVDMDKNPKKIIFLFEGFFGQSE